MKMAKQDFSFWGGSMDQHFTLLDILQHTENCRVALQGRKVDPNLTSILFFKETSNK